MRGHQRGAWANGRRRRPWRLHRIRLGPEEFRGPAVVLSPPNAHHVREVLRLRHGDQLRGLAPDGFDLILRIEGNGGRLRCAVEGELPPLPEPGLRVSICQGLTRAERFELVLQKGAEIGACDFYPVITARTVIRLHAAQAASRAGRWRRIVEEAALQCGRAHIPEVHPPMSLSGLARMIAERPPDLMLVPYENETASLRDVLRSAASGPRPVTAAVVVGPEGGFEPREIGELCSAGFRPVSLGPRILRTETAGPLVLSLLLYELGDVGGRGVQR